MKAFGIEVRRVNRVTVIRCTGALVEGSAMADLHRAVSSVLPVEPFVVLNLAGVEYVDSYGLGVLTRLLASVEGAGGSFKLCAVPPNVARVLSLTRLSGVLETHASEEEALAAFAHVSRRDADVDDVRTDVLCVESTPEVLAFVQEVLRAVGLRVATASNVPDAAVLFKVRRPRVLVIGAALRQAFEVQANLRPGTPLIELPVRFGSEEPAAAAERLLQQVRAIVPAQS